MRDSIIYITSGVLIFIALAILCKIPALNYKLSDFEYLLIVVLCFGFVGLIASNRRP